MVSETLTPGKMTIFPAASIHTMYNTGSSSIHFTERQGAVAYLVLPIGCTNAQLVSALSSEDAGTHNIANGLFGLPLDLVNVALGGTDNVNVTAHSIPGVGTGSISGTAACLARCKAQGKRV